MSGREASIVRRKAPVVLPAVGGFPFGRKPNVLLAVDELFVRARSTNSQARSACVIAGRRGVSIRPKAEGFARRRRVSIWPKVLLAVGELFVRVRSACVIARVDLLFVRARSARSQAFAVCELFVRAPVVRREALVILPAVGGF